ncbi:transposase family protein [Streptomyces sp. NPDC056844]|uniref:transposase family protein n=1 Tax=unclassified Streptomyces TaxID=2593676 RepID=UPI00369AD025
MSPRRRRDCARASPRQRAGPRWRGRPRVFRTDRLLVTLVHLRHQWPHAAPAELFDVGPSNVSETVRQVQPHGLRPRRPRTGRSCGFGPWRTSAHTPMPRVSSCGWTGTRPGPGPPPTGRPSRTPAFISGKRRQNTMKATTFSDSQGRMLFASAVRPGRMHDQTALRTEDIAEQFRTRRNHANSLIEKSMRRWEVPTDGEERH